MKYYITKSNHRSIKLDHLHYVFKPMLNFSYNSKKKCSNNNSNVKKKYIYGDDNFNLTFGKKVNNNIETNESKNNHINNDKIKSLNLMNNQIFNNNFIFNINNYRGNAKSTKNKIFKDIINEENTPSFNNENKEEDKKNINNTKQQKKMNLPKNYINIEELKLNNHILQNLIHKKKIKDNSKTKINDKSKVNISQTPRNKPIRQKISLIEEINKRVKTKYNKNKDNKKK